MAKIWDDGVCERYCIGCDKKQPYEIRKRIGKLDIRGRSIEFKEKYAVCSVCGEEMYVPEISNGNIDAVEAAYYKLVRGGTKM